MQPNTYIVAERVSFICDSETGQVPQPQCCFQSVLVSTCEYTMCKDFHNSESHEERNLKEADFITALTLSPKFWNGYSTDYSPQNSGTANKSVGLP